MKLTGANVRAVVEPIEITTESFGISPLGPQLSYRVRATNEGPMRFAAFMTPLLMPFIEISFSLHAC
jgi:hypothetical protein